MTTGRPGTRYMPALDGLRACAVAAVIAYHLGFGWARGGYLGVDAFFVLSGFLITTLLVEERDAAGRISLPAFWGRRARRLLPALLLVLFALSVFALLSGPGLDPGRLRGDALAALFYVANWHEIFSHASYFAQFSAPSPLQHTWSLGIEEQFYLLWPLVLVAVLGTALARGRHAPRRPVRRRRLLVLALAGGAASALGMALGDVLGAGTNRLYLGTDTRAFELLFGAALAALGGLLPALGRRARVALQAAALPAAAGLLVLWSRAPDPPGWMFEGGFVLAALLVTLVIAAAVQPVPGPVGKVLSLRPLRWVGTISYGLYLWHWPVIVLCSQNATGLSGLSLVAVQLALTVGAATLSYYLVERPLRRMSLSGWRRFVLAPAGVVATAVLVVGATVPGVAAAPSAAPTAPAGSRPAMAAVQTTGEAAVGGFALPAGRVPTPGNPLRVLLFGDSVMRSASPGIEAALDATGVVKASSVALDGWGLSTSNWRTAFPKVVAQFRPEILVGTWSWDNQAALAHPRAYTSEVDQLLSVLLAPGDGVDGVVLVQFPPLGPLPALSPEARAVTTAQRSAGLRAWDRIAASRPAAYPGRVAYFPVARSLEVNGRYSAWLPNGSGGWVRARSVDNTHMCPAGVVRYASAVLDDLDAMLGVAGPGPGSTWWAGAWTANPVYNTPPGFCPNDQPPG